MHLSFTLLLEKTVRSLLNHLPVQHSSIGDLTLRPIKASWRKALCLCQPELKDALRAICRQLFPEIGFFMEINNTEVGFRKAGAGQNESAPLNISHATSIFAHPNRKSHKLSSKRLLEGNRPCHTGCPAS